MKTASVTRVRIENQERWAQITLSLRDHFEGGSLVKYPDQFACRLQGADALAASYDLNNWESGLMSGVLYAFRALKQPRRRVFVSELEGYLRSEDMPALALASSIAVTDLLEGDVSPLQMSGWRSSIS